MKRWAVLFLLFIAVVIALSDAGACSYLCAPAKAVAYGDKLGHFVLVGLFAAAVFGAVTQRTIRLWSMDVSIAALGVCAFISGEELSQLWIPTRSADWGDLGASYAGIVLFELLRTSSMSSSFAGD